MIIMVEGPFVEKEESGAARFGPLGANSPSSWVLFFERLLALKSQRFISKVLLPDIDYCIKSGANCA